MGLVAKKKTNNDLIVERLLKEQGISLNEYRKSVIVKAGTALLKGDTPENKQLIDLLEKYYTQELYEAALIKKLNLNQGSEVNV